MRCLQPCRHSIGPITLTPTLKVQKQPPSSPVYPHPHLETSPHSAWAHRTLGALSATATIVTTIPTTAKLLNSQLHHIRPLEQHLSPPLSLSPSSESHGFKPNPTCELASTPPQATLSATCCWPTAPLTLTNTSIQSNHMKYQCISNHLAPTHYLAAKIKNFQKCSNKFQKKSKKLLHL